MRVAGVDIGTNTILMVISDVGHDGTISIISDHHAIARIGKNVDADGAINPEAIQRAVTILQQYKEICKNANVQLMNAVATSAVRSANNSKKVLSELSDALGATIRCISGSEEAEVTYKGTVPTKGEYTVIDIGGGSTEVITGSNGCIKHQTSIEIGAVRITERFHLSTDHEHDYINDATQYIAEQMHTIQFPIAANVYAVAGTPTTLAQMSLQQDVFNETEINNYKLTANTIDACLQTILTTPNNVRGTITGVNPARADILLAGALILQQFMTHFRAPQVTVSTKGLRYGLLHNHTQSFTNNDGFFR